MPGTPELLIIAFIVVVLFGAKKVPELMRGTGQAVREFRQGTKDIQSDLEGAKRDLEGEKPPGPVHAPRW